MGGLVRFSWCRHSSCLVGGGTAAHRDPASHSLRSELKILLARRMAREWENVEDMLRNQTQHAWLDVNLVGILSETAKPKGGWMCEDLATCDIKSPM